MANSDCGCGKPKPGPLGGTQRPSPQISGGLAGKTQSFALQPHTLTFNGQTQKFGSLLEAQAEAVRTGGGSIKPA